MTLKQFIHYLPYGLEVINFKTDKVYRVIGYCYIANKPMVQLYSSDGITAIEFWDKDYKLLLRPLDDLVLNDYPFELQKLAISSGLYSMKHKPLKERFDYAVIKKPFGKVFKLQNFGDWVLFISFNEPYRIKQVFFEKLIEWKFDVFSLIEKGYAIELK